MCVHKINDSLLKYHKQIVTDKCLQFKNQRKENDLLATFYHIKM